MWIFTKYGFFSAVCARQGDGSHGQPVDPDRVMLRARVRRHLELLKEQFAEQLGGSEIKEYPVTDYAFRIFLPKTAWSRLVSELTNVMDYDNFKSEVARHQGRALHDVWSVMHQLQK